MVKPVVPPMGTRVRVPSQLWEVTAIDVYPDGTICLGVEPVMSLVWVRPEDVETVGPEGLW